jgi:TPR repeat protein
MKATRSDIARFESTFVRASMCWDAGDLKHAFRLFKSLAMRGDRGAYLNVGYCFDEGVGVRKNQAKALYWYRRGFAGGNASAANNIGTIYRDRGDPKRAISWFRKAIDLGSDGSALEIAKIYLAQGTYLSRAMRYLERVAASERVCESDQDEAKRMIKRLRRTQNLT